MRAHLELAQVAGSDITRSERAGCRRAGRRRDTAWSELEGSEVSRWRGGSREGEGGTHNTPPRGLIIGLVVDGSEGDRAVRGRVDGGRRPRSGVSRFWHEEAHFWAVVMWMWWMWWMWRMIVRTNTRQIQELGGKPLPCLGPHSPSTPRPPEVGEWGRTQPPPGCLRQGPRDRRIADADAGRRVAACN